MRTIQVGNSKETVVERADYPPERIKAVLDDAVRFAEDSPDPAPEEAVSDLYA